MSNSQCVRYSTIRNLISVSLVTSSIALKPWQRLSPPEQTAVLAISVTSEQVTFAGTIEQSVGICKADEFNRIAGLAIFDALAVSVEIPPPVSSW
ncbi:hypothetical protein [Hydrogenophaga taeniospiralis]|uniref:hypothetical protein n=1 Tax=Hydrogenophaga taeniospiralis TaxID=65656 RepID=UPI00082DC63E|nr:hypothetical protein [Hydrogenophaga taeniospiralis]